LQRFDLGGDSGQIGLEAGEVVLYRLENFITGDNGLVQILKLGFILLD